jgi:hypothetical protein
MKSADDSRTESLTCLADAFNWDIGRMAENLKARVGRFTIPSQVPHSSPKRGLNGPPVTRPAKFKDGEAGEHARCHSEKGREEQGFQLS